MPPEFTFWISRLEDTMMFGMYFVVAIVMGQLIARFRTQEKAERRREERTTALYLLTRELADAVTLDQIVKVMVQHIGKPFEAEVAVLLAERGRPTGESAVRGKHVEADGKRIERGVVGVPAQPARGAIHGQPAARRTRCICR